MVIETPFVYNDERTYAIPFDDGLTGSLSNISDIDWFSINIDTVGTTEIAFSMVNPGLWSVDWYNGMVRPTSLTASNGP